MKLPRITALLASPIIAETRDDDTAADPKGIHTNPKSMLAAITVIGGFVGASTVQHLTGLSLTNPVIASFGPAGFVGTLGLSQLGLRALMDRRRLEAFGWSTDQSPIRGPREALTVAPTEVETIHYGKGVDRQQTQLGPATAAGAVTVIGNNRMQLGVPMDTKCVTVRGIYHTNVVWLGQANGPIVDCRSFHRWNSSVVGFGLGLILASAVLMTLCILGEVKFLTHINRLPPMVPVGLYFVSKISAVSFLTARFIAEVWSYSPQTTCSKTSSYESGRSSASCVPTRVKVYRQRGSAALDYQYHSIVCCEKAYQTVQGILHPALQETSAQFPALPYWLRRSISIFLDSCCGASIAAVVFFYSWYISWLTDNASAKASQVFPWIAGELSLLGLKVWIMTRRPHKSIAPSYGHIGGLDIESNAGHIMFKSVDMSRGVLRAITVHHIVFSSAFFRYAHHAMLSTVHHSFAREDVTAIPAFFPTFSTFVPHVRPNCTLWLNLRQGMKAVDLKKLESPFAFGVGETTVKNKTVLCIGLENPHTQGFSINGPADVNVCKIRRAQLSLSEDPTSAGTIRYQLDLDTLHSFADTKLIWFEFSCETTKRAISNVIGGQKVVQQLSDSHKVWVRPIDNPTLSALRNRGACYQSNCADNHTCICPEHIGPCCKTKLKRKKAS